MVFIKETIYNVRVLLSDWRASGPVYCSQQ